MARVLFVEDDPGWQGIFASLLKAAGHESRRATTVDDALSILADNSNYDTIVFDLRLGRSKELDEPFVWLEAFVDGLRFRNNRIPPIIIVTGVDITVSDVITAFTEFRGIVFSLFTKSDFDHTKFMRTIKLAETYTRDVKVPRKPFFQLLLAAILVTAVVLAIFAFLIWGIGRIPDPQTQQVVLKTGVVVIIIIAIFAIVFSQNENIIHILTKVIKLWRS